MSDTIVREEDLRFVRAAFERFAPIGALAGGGVTRLGFSPEEDAMHAAFAALCAQEGFDVTADGIGNSFAAVPGAQGPYTLLGSHLDSVVEGGCFDGVAGVIAGLLVMRRLREDGCPLPVRTAAFRCEESSRFGRATIGSGLLTQEISVLDVMNLTDAEGVRFADILQERRMPLLPEKIKGVTRYLELHIEQGKILEESKRQVGIVKAIAAPRRFTVRLTGLAEHSGATPMQLRSDALCAAAEIILGVERIGRNESIYHSVATVGVIRNTPNVLNVIPGEVSLGVDLRGIDTASLARMETALGNLCESVCGVRPVAYEKTPLSASDPVAMDEEMQSGLLAAAHARGISAMRMISGAGHDAASFAPICPTAMVFIPCRNGVSHNKLEFTTPEAVCTGAEVILEYLRGCVQ